MAVSIEELRAKFAAKRLEKQPAASENHTDPAPPPATENHTEPPPAKPRRKLKALPAPRVEPPVDLHRETIPHSVEAELGVLSSILIDYQFAKSSRVIDEVMGKINPFHFHVPAHKTAFEMMLALRREEKPIELISFTQLLRDRGLLDAIGGAAFVTSLINYVPTAANVEYYLEIMIEQFRRREMIALGTRMVRAAYAAHEEDSIELVKSFEYRIQRLREDRRDPALMDVAELLNGEKPPLPRLIVHHVLHEGAKMIIGGGSKARKTWGLMDLALAISTGSEWWGFKTYKSRVCYINLELQSPFFADRIDNLITNKGVHPEPGFFEVLNLRGRIETVESLRQKYTPFLKAGHFRTLIIDPSYKLLGGRDENAAGEIATLLNEFEKIAVDIEAAVVFASHYSKGNQALKEFMDRIGGSGVFARDPDVVMTMTQHEETDCFTVETRCRNLASPSAFVVRWEYPAFVRDEDKDPVKLKGTPGAKQIWTEKDILGEFRVGEGWSTPKLQKHLDKERGMPRSTFYRIWDKLKNEQKIRVDQEGDWFRVLKSDENNLETTDGNVSHNNSET